MTFINIKEGVEEANKTSRSNQNEDILGALGDWWDSREILGDTEEKEELQNITITVVSFLTPSIIILTLN